MVPAQNTRVALAALRQCCKTAFVVHVGGAAPARTVLVVAIGGCTLAEMTAMRVAAAQLNTKLVFLTSDIITGTRLVQSFVPDSAALADADAAATAAAL